MVTTGAPKKKGKEERKEKKKIKEKKERKEGDKKGNDSLGKSTCREGRLSGMGCAPSLWFVEIRAPESVWVP